MKKVGAFVGKFYPPHIGHLWVIDNAIKDMDEVYIIISKNENRNQQISKSQNFKVLDASLIQKWFKEHYKNNPKVKVEIFDESGLRPYPEDRDVWAERFKKQFPSVNVKIADEGYREYNQEYFPEYEFYPIDRDVVNIHSTQIRNNIKENLNYIIPEARDYFGAVALKNDEYKY